VYTLPIFLGKNFDIGWVGLVGGSHLRVRKIFLKKAIILLLSYQDKKYLFGLGQKIPGTNPGQPLFPAGQKYARV